MSIKPKICVVGSINMDLVTTTKTMPAKGETVMGETFAIYPGGKGANQAVAAAKLGAEVTMIGAVGDDPFGKNLLNHFKSERILTNGIKRCTEIATGIATIILSDQDNRIIVASGANKEVSPEWVEHHKNELLKSDLVLLQFEIPMETIKYTTHLAAENGIPVVINPAPSHTMPNELLEKATYFTPNDIEFLAMNDMPNFDRMQEKMIVTKGEKGVQVSKENGQLHMVPAFKVRVEDTTGAGDTFNGALATELARGIDLEKAVNFANAAAALSVTKLGAQGGMPTRHEVENFLVERENHNEF